jgi:uracil-DNA glycosylase
MKKLLEEIRGCTLCKAHLPLGPRPILSVDPKSKVIIIGQAPGSKVHASGIPWDDASGNELRRWLGVTKEEFYDPKKFALMPMGFCYPGKGTSGDMPPRPECAPKWHDMLLKQMKEVI